ncbi:hypothetical protein PO909_015902 [Leuciscus waleckii]
MKNNFNSLSQKKLELETRVNDLSAEKSQLQRSVDALNQKKLELETRVNDLSVKKLELETRVNDLSAEKSQLQGSFDALNQKKLELETRVNDLSVEKGQREVLQRSEKGQREVLQRSFDALNQKKLELETRVTSWSEEPKKEKSKQGILLEQVVFLSGFLWGPDGLFMSSEPMSWSDSRHYCRDRGADLVIINTEEKQRRITSFIKERVWIGLYEIENEGIMKWVDDSPLTQGFWADGEPNNYRGEDEDCIELNPKKHTLNNWNDLRCSEKKKGICEK